MNDDDGLPPQREPATSPDSQSEIDIVAILQSLEARIADHADRMSEQLGPVRASIAQIANRLDEVEKSVSASDELPTPATVAQPADQEPDPAPEPAPSSLNLRPADLAGTHLPPDLSEETIREDAPEPAFEPTTPPVRAAADTSEPVRPDNITEEDIHAADAALKSELTGLFDDGIHQGAAQQRISPADDPFLPPRPPRPTSRAPLVFVVAILLAVCAGIGAVAWFEFLSPEARRSLTSQISSITAQKSEATEPALPPATPETAATPAPTAPNPPVSTPPVALPSAATGPTPSSATPSVEPPPAMAPEPEPTTAAVDVPAPRVTTPERAAATEPERQPATTAETAPPPPPAPIIDPVRADTTPPEATAAADAPPANPELEALRREAVAGSASAQNDLGVRYLVGRGVAQDFTVAADWLRKAAAQDMTNAQYNLGVLYDSGRGVEPDPTEALIWFHTAAEKGHGRAQMAVAAAYASGRGIERNPDEALRWLRRAAESNIGEAQFSLANILATSPSSQESLIDAYVWYRVADANGVTQASERADQVAARLTPEERAGANARVSHFLGRNLPKPNLKPSSNSTAPNSASPSGTPAPATATAAAEPSGPAAVTSAEIEEIQTLLGRLGFNAGIADGRAGRQTTDAIRNYQRELGLPVDGEPSQALLRNLRQIAGAR